MNDFNQFLPRCYYGAPIVCVSVKLNYRYLASAVLNAPAMLCIQAMLLRWDAIMSGTSRLRYVEKEDFEENIFFALFLRGTGDWY